MLVLLSLCGSPQAQKISKQAISAGLRVDALQPNFSSTHNSKFYLRKVTPAAALLLPSDADILLTVSSKDFLFCKENLSAQFKVLVADYRGLDLGDSFQSFWKEQVTTLQHSNTIPEILRLEEFESYSDLLTELIGKDFSIDKEPIVLKAIDKNSIEYSKQLSLVGYEK